MNEWIRTFWAWRWLWLTFSGCSGFFRASSASPSQDAGDLFYFLSFWLSCVVFWSDFQEGCHHCCEEILFGQNLDGLQAFCDPRVATLTHCFPLLGMGAGYWYSPLFHPLPWSFPNQGAYPPVHETHVKLLRWSPLRSSHHAWEREAPLTCTPQCGWELCAESFSRILSYLQPPSPFDTLGVHYSWFLETCS